MSKKYKGKPCVYCESKESNGTDHVIAREFFPLNQRANLPKVPSCDECNSIKSSLEHYAITVLPFGSKHEDAKDMLKNLAPKRLKKNKKLQRELQNKSERIWLKSSSDLIVPSMTFPIKGDKLKQLFAMIVRGLYWHNWKLILPINYFVEIYTLNLEGLIYFRDNLLLQAPSNFIEQDFGKGVFHYRATKGDEDLGISAWEMFFYNGMTIAGHKNQIIFFCCLTGPEEILDETTIN